jgi:hypothetical protein
MWKNFYGRKFLRKNFGARVKNDKEFILGGAMLLLISISIALNTLLQPFDSRGEEWFNLTQDPMS